MIGVFHTRLWVFDTSHRLECKCTEKTELQPQNDTCIEVKWVSCTSKSTGHFTRYKSLLSYYKKMYLQVAMSCFSKNALDLSHLYPLSFFPDIYRKWESLLQERMKVRRKLWCTLRWVMAKADSKRDRREEKHQAPTPSPMAVRFTDIKAWIR